MTTEPEGIIQFRAEHEPAPAVAPKAISARLSAWRRVLRELGMIGHDPGRYGGLGFGNVSARVAGEAPIGTRGFVISGVQTGMRPELGSGDFALVYRWDIASNVVYSRGPVLPSSESMTHAALYDLSPRVQWVFHVHAPDVWHAVESLGLASTRPGITYGTPAMAAEMQRMARDFDFEQAGALAMAGHEDGIVAFGPTAAATGSRLVELLACAFELQAR